jgi:uncharacterized DUF497 family protein
MASRYEWDPAKAAANEKKHGITFEMAREAFRDPLAVQEPDTREDYGEDRYSLIGMVENRLMFVAFTEEHDDDTGEDVIRIISTRRATARERRKYHEA